MQEDEGRRARRAGHARVEAGDVETAQSGETAEFHADIVRENARTSGDSKILRKRIRKSWKGASLKENKRKS
jgi:hypothetical protein